MHLKVLNKKQEELIPYLKTFKHSFFLVGGTAIALHLGHRRSIDYDLFTNGSFNKSNIRKKLNPLPYKRSILFEDIDQMHILWNNVKTTFFQFPYKIEHPFKIEDIISMPLLIDLAAMKAFALGRRSKWKDYVDLFFIIKNNFSISEISTKAIELFKDQFSEKLFREQIAFHKDIDYTEEVKFIE